MDRRTSCNGKLVFTGATSGVMGRKRVKASLVRVQRTGRREFWRARVRSKRGFRLY